MEKLYVIDQNLWDTLTKVDPQADAVQVLHPINGTRAEDIRQQVADLQHGIGQIVPRLGLEMQTVSPPNWVEEDVFEFGEARVDRGAILIRSGLEDRLQIRIGLASRSCAMDPTLVSTRVQFTLRHLLNHPKALAQLSNAVLSNLQDYMHFVNNRWNTEEHDQAAVSIFHTAAIPLMEPSSVSRSINRYNHALRRVVSKMTTVYLPLIFQFVLESCTIPNYIVSEWYDNIVSQQLCSLAFYTLYPQEMQYKFVKLYAYMIVNPKVPPETIKQMFVEEFKGYDISNIKYIRHPSGYNVLLNIPYTKPTTPPEPPTDDTSGLVDVIS